MMKSGNTLCAVMVGAAVFGAGSVASGPAFAQSKQAECDAYAYDVAQSRGKGRVGIGAVVGGATGAIVGGIVGGGRGAAIGAGAGAAAGSAGGLVSKDLRRKKVYKDAYADCMAGRVR